MKAAGQREEKQLEDGYEVMKLIGPQSNKEAGSPASGGTVNLILNLSNPGDSLVQVLDQPTQAGESADESAEPVHRVRSSLTASHQKSPETVVQLHHMTFMLCRTRLSVLCPSHSPPPHTPPLLFFSPSARCASVSCL